MAFTTLSVNCVLELTEVSLVKKKHALVLWESPKFCKQRVYQDNVHKINKKSVKYPLSVIFTGKSCFTSPN